MKESILGLSKQTCYSKWLIWIKSKHKLGGFQFVKNVEVLNLQDNYKQNKISKIFISYETEYLVFNGFIHWKTKKIPVNYPEVPIKLCKREMGNIIVRVALKQMLSYQLQHASAFCWLWQEVCGPTLQLPWHGTAAIDRKRETACKQESNGNIIFRSRFWLNYYNECRIDPTEFNFIILFSIA